MSTHETRMARLPKWAQQRIEALERDLAHAKAQVAQAAGEAETDTRALRGYNEGDLPLPAGSRIQFGTGHMKVEARWENDGLYVSTIGGSMVITPHVSNAVTISSEDRFS